VSVEHGTQPLVLVLNAGSSSLKYRLLRGDRTRASGIVERIGEAGGRAGDHAEAFGQVVAELGAAADGLAVVGHRVVHGGTRFRAATVVDDTVLAAIDELAPLAPLHNPANAQGIRAARQRYPQVPQVAVFDTAFHADLPAAAATYALDAALAARHGIRRYGFHGTSHRYVAGRTAALLGRPLAELNTIVLHLGNGASATAVARGRSVETSMGMTPLEGLVMGTRSGDIDPAVVFHLLRAGMSADEVEAALERQGGLRGLCGANDVRDLLSRVDDGDPAAMLALDVYCHRIRKYVGAYHAVLGRLDAVAFTAGVGEHAVAVRARALAGLAPLGIGIDPARDTAAATGERVVSAPGARVAVCVVPTDEELAIAQESVAAVAATRD